MVDNTEDAKLLKQIFDKYGQKNIPIYTRKFSNQRYQCPLATPSPGSRCLIEVVDIQDTDIFNLLVDVGGINVVLLFDSVETALTKLKRVESVPKNCALAIDAEYNRVNPAPRYRILSNDKPTHVQLLKEAGGEKLTQLNAEMKELRAKENATEKQLQQVQKELASIEGEIRKAKDRRTKLSLEVASLETKLRDLQDFEASTDKISSAVY